jgi:hypothetical protein
MLLALMEIRALSPHHSIGLKGAESQRRFGKRRSDRFAVNVKINLRNLWQVFYSWRVLCRGEGAVVVAAHQECPHDPGILVGQRHRRDVWSTP